MGAFERLYDAVSSTIGADGKTVIQLRNDATNPDREVRKASYDKEKKVWAEHEAAFAACLNSIKGTVLTLEKRRGWSSPLEHSAAQARISVKALDALIRTLEKNLPMFRKYFGYKAKLLGVEKMAWYDLFAPVGKSTREYTFEEAKDVIIRCYSAFDPRMGAFAANALIPNEEWKNAPKVRVNPALIQRKYTQWANEKGLNKWIVLGRISYETGMYKFRSDESRRIG